VQLARWQPAFAALGVRVAGMSYDDRPLLAAFHARHELPYPLLQDEDATHVTAYGIRNEAYAPGEAGYGVPHPGILFIAPGGEIRAKFALPGYRERPPFETVHGHLETLVAP